MCTMKKTLTGFALAAAMAPNFATAQDDVIIPNREAFSNVELVSANPEAGFATIAVGNDGYTQSMDCGTLNFHQEDIELKIAYHASAMFVSPRVSELKILLGMGTETLESVHQNYAHIASEHPADEFDYAAQLGKERGVFVEAQIEAGCLTPKGIQDRGLPAPSND